jgi:hypothetical protein
MVSKHLISAICVLSLLTASCSHSDKPLTSQEKARIEKEVIFSIENHVKTGKPGG